MVFIKKIEEVVVRSKFDSMVKYRNRIVLKDGNLILVEMRFIGSACYFHVVEKCSHLRAVKLVRSYVKKINGNCSKNTEEGDTGPDWAYCGNIGGNVIIAA